MIMSSLTLALKSRSVGIVRNASFLTEFSEGGCGSLGQSFQKAKSFGRDSVLFEVTLLGPKETSRRYS
jgi:hypothetical protein